MDVIKRSGLMLLRLLLSSDDFRPTNVEGALHVISNSSGDVLITSNDIEQNNITATKSTYRNVTLDGSSYKTRYCFEVSESAFVD